ncbi:tyrosine-type recombinase/integrase [Deinococcus multiflagellatus]|uniref:Tyrosine-type recombinase/integrase n=2 Tax=Deinococcus multiflagellatus TaxID=1656887 RepID=A0ABW1ZRC5_9DEIO
MCALEYQDVDFVQAQLVVRHGKGNKSRIVPLTDELATALRALPVKPAGEALLWRSYHKLRERMQEVCTLMQVEWRGLHALRHTAGTELYRATGDLYVTAQLLGHKDIKTTQVYVHMSQQHLRDALRKRAG